MANNFPGRGLNVAISRIPQTDYATATAVAANAFVRETLKNPTVAQITPRERNNDGYATGLGFPSESWVEAWESSWPFAFDVSFENIGRYLLASMGKVTTSQPASVTDPTVYQHLFDPLPFLTTSQLPAFSGVAQLLPSANGIDELIPSLISRKLSLRSAGLAKLDGSVDWVGSGKRTAASGVTWATHVNEIAGTQNYPFGKQNELIISDTDGTSNLSNVKCDIQSGMFDVTNTLADDDYGCPTYLNNDPAQGAFRSQHQLVRQQYDLGWTIKLRDSDPETAALLSRRPMKIIEKWVGATISNTYTFLLEISAYLAKYASVGRNIGGGFVTVDVKPDLLYSTAASKILQVKLINTTPSYTT